MNFQTSSRVRNILGFVVLASLVVTSCGGGQADTSRSRNATLPEQAAPIFYRSTVCTNFFGAYNKDMAAPGAQVTLRFCPEATKIVLKFGNEDAIATDITTGDPQITIDGSSFIERGSLQVSVHREFIPAGKTFDDLTSLPLGQFVLSTASIENETRLVGTWSTTEPKKFLDFIGGPTGLSESRGIIFYTSQLFDQYYWFARDRCRSLASLSESEAFNLEFTATGFFLSLKILLGASSIAAKNADGLLTIRRDMFNKLNLLQTLNDEAQFSDFTTSCEGNRDDRPLEITNQQQLNFKTAAPLLRKAITDVHTNLCIEDPSQINLNSFADQYKSVDALVGTAELWRYSDEPDRGALESAQVRLNLLVGNADVNWSRIRPTYGCEFRSWGQEVWTADQLNEFYNPTVITSAPDTSVPDTSAPVASAPDTSVPAQSNEQASANANTDTTIAQTTSSQAIGEAPRSQVVTPKAAAPLQPPVAAPAAVIVAAKPLLTVGKKMKFKTVSVLAGLTLKKGNTVKVAVIAASKSVCKVSKGTVMATKAGTCSLRVSVLQGKKTLKRTTVSVVTGN